MSINQFDTTNWLQELRRERHLTLRILAEQIGISPTTLCRIEKGEKIPEYECISALCEAMELNKDDRAKLMFSFGFMEVDGA